MLRNGQCYNQGQLAVYLSGACLFPQSNKLLAQRPFAEKRANLPLKKKGLKSGKKLGMYIASTRGANMNGRQQNSHILQEELGQVELSSLTCWDTSNLQKVKPECNASQKAWHLVVNS